GRRARGGRRRPGRGRAGAADRGAAGRRAVRGGRARAGAVAGAAARAGGVDRGALHVTVVPGAVGDPVLEADRPRAGRRRRVQARAAGRSGVLARGVRLALRLVVRAFAVGGGGGVAAAVRGRRRARGGAAFGDVRGAAGSAAVA